MAVGLPTCDVRFVPVSTRVHRPAVLEVRAGHRHAVHAVACSYRRRLSTYVEGNA